MFSTQQLDTLQQAYLETAGIEAACFLKQEVIGLLDLIKDDPNSPYVKVLLIRTEDVGGGSRVSMAMCGGTGDFRKATQGIVSTLPCPPYCGHG